jgi:hypothetical protein
MNTIVPVTQAELTQTNINYSTKIGKQVMKAQLTERLKMLFTVRELAGTANYHHAEGFSDKLREYLNSKVDMFLNNDGEITRLRNLINKFSSAENEFKNNVALKDGTNAHGVIRNFVDTRKVEKLAEIIELGELTVNVNLRLNGFVKDEDDQEQIGFSIAIQLSTETLEWLAQRIDLVNAKAKADADYDACDEKLRNIDAVVEEMEAKLLVNQLMTTEEGKKVLAVTSELVQQMLGNTPDMFKSLPSLTGGK